jgi:DNA-binding CsgD family transcriptional regulator
MNGTPYWSHGILEQLRRHATGARSICQLLTPTEQLVFAVIGDGSDDDIAATRLGLRPSTIGSIRRELHRKLNVQHRGELMRAAIQHGFVRITPEGVVRPGFGTLSHACRPRRTRLSTVHSDSATRPARTR